MHPWKRFWLWSCPVRRRSPGSMWSLVPCLILNKNYDKLTRNLCDPFKLRECFVTVATYGQWSAGEDGSASSTTTDNSTASKFLSKSSQHSSICKTKKHDNKFDRFKNNFKLPDPSGFRKSRIKRWTSPSSMKMADCFMTKAAAISSLPLSSDSAWTGIHETWRAPKLDRIVYKFWI